MPIKTLKIDLVDEMVTNYTDNQLDSILTSTVHPMTMDAESVWFDLKSLKTFLAAIEEETDSHPEYNLKNFGVRFYYTAYPKKALWDKAGYEDLAGMLLDPTAKDYEKLHTLIAIPTAEINGVNQDFDPFDEKTYNGTKPSSGQGVSIMAENHGLLVPPNSATGLWF
ncbi:hypothetical protein [Flavobacterium sp.]